MPWKITDISGYKFDRLTVLRFSHRDAHRETHWLCKCECGKTVVVRKEMLTTHKTKSCGCLKKALLCNGLHKTHGMSSTRLYREWSGIMSRIYNRKERSYKNYGGRGIKVCDDWKEFEHFCAWALSNGYNDNLSIERIDVNGDYCPSNCKWVPLAEQARNKRNSRFVSFKGETFCVAEWEQRLGLPTETVRRRLNNGWSVERALTEPLHKEYRRHKNAL